jgi:hypothetical protein
VNFGPKISIVVPTVEGREDHLERCLDAYTHRSNSAIELIVIKDEATCGIAWQKGAEQATGEYLHFTADDLEPALAWDLRARHAAQDGIIPMPLIVGPDNHVEPLGPNTQGCTRIPFCTMEQWDVGIGPMIPLHYYTDNWFSKRAAQAGLLLREVRGYTFKHHWAQPARGAGMSQMDRMIHDEQEFHRYMREGFGG